MSQARLEVPPAKARPKDVSPETWALARGYWWLHRIWERFSEAEDELRAARGAPNCVADCGLCCVTNTPAAHGIEVKRAASWLLEQTPTARTAILDRIERWLVRPTLEVSPILGQDLGVAQPDLGSAPAGWGHTPNQVYQVLAAERGRCPLLGDDLHCLVYEVRPLGCRAWGITTTPDHYCKRPQGLGESATTRSIFGGPGTNRLRAALRGLKNVISGQPKLDRVTFFPTALYAEFRATRLTELLPSVPIAKRVGNGFSHQLFDEPLEQPLPPELTQVEAS